MLRTSDYTGDLTVTDEDLEILSMYDNDWNKFARDVLGVRMSRKQRQGLELIQHNKKVSIWSAHACGKDFLAAVASLCHLYLRYPSKVINTAPTNRQVIDIMMSEVTRLHRSSKVPLGGRVLAGKITFPGDSTWFLEGFKTRDKNKEDWSGYHSPNLMVVVTEASGVDDEAFQAIEGILTGNSCLVLIFNPNRNSGEAFSSTTDPRFAKLKMSAFDSPNVRAKKELIPGMVDYDWVDDKIGKAGWTTEISEGGADKALNDFKWKGKWHRPSNLFLPSVLGKFPRATADMLIPREWLDAAVKRWKKLKGKGKGTLILGGDIAGMGVDLTTFCMRRGWVIEEFKMFSHQDHMVTAGKIKNELKDEKDVACIDSIGEGAGVYSRLLEQGVNAESVKGSRSAKMLCDLTGERTFFNMRAYLHWAVRDALDPNFNPQLALPLDEDFIREATSIKWTTRSNGQIIIEPKKNIKERIGRSPDRFDSLTCTFLPLLNAGLRIISIGDDDSKHNDSDDDDIFDDGEDVNQTDKRESYSDRLVRRLEEDEDD